MYLGLSPYNNTSSNVLGNKQIQGFFDYEIQKDWFYIDSSNQ